MAEERGRNKRVAVQDREFVLGGQFNEEGTTRLEVALLTSGGKTKIELRLLGWGEGIGWYAQKRMQLDPRQISTLKAILGRGASKAKSSAQKLKMTCNIVNSAHRNHRGLSLSLCP